MSQMESMMSVKEKGGFLRLNGHLTLTLVTNTTDMYLCYIP